MFRWLLLATVVTLCLAEEAAPAAEAAAAGETVPDLKAEESAHRQHDIQYNDYGEDLPGTGVLREVRPSGHQLPHRRIQEQNKIVYDRYSPNYYQPTWILDYRYLPTGGRDYVRGEGGQILILPKGMKAPHDEHKQFGNFDELLEHLRLQELAEREDLHRRRTGHGKQHHNDHDKHDEHQEHHDRHGHGDHWRENEGWQREVEREQRYDNRLRSGHGHRSHEAERWQKAAFGK